MCLAVLPITMIFLSIYRVVLLDSGWFRLVVVFGRAGVVSWLSYVGRAGLSELCWLA